MDIKTTNKIIITVRDSIGLTLLDVLTPLSGTIISFPSLLESIQNLTRDKKIYNKYDQIYLFIMKRQCKPLFSLHT